MKLLFVVLAFITWTADAQDPREIIKRYLDTVSNGNVENWKNVKTQYVESLGYYSQNTFEQKIDLLHPDKASFTKTFIRWPETKIESYSDSTCSNLLSSSYFLKDKVVMLIGNVPPIIKSPFSRSEFSDQFLPETIGKLLIKSKSIQLLGVRDFPLDGVSCYEISIKHQNLNWRLYINTTTFLLDFSNTRDDADPTFLAKYFDYKKVDGFLIPMSESLAHQGVVYYWNTKTKVELNAEIDTEKFIYKEEKR